MKPLHLFYMPYQQMRDIVDDCGECAFDDCIPLSECAQLEGYMDKDMYVHHRKTLPPDVILTLRRLRPFNKITIVTYNTL